jgi:hypothetical protein
MVAGFEGVEGMKFLESTEVSRPTLIGATAVHAGIASARPYCQTGLLDSLRAAAKKQIVGLVHYPQSSRSSPPENLDLDTGTQLQSAAKDSHMQPGSEEEHHNLEGEVSQCSKKPPGSMV